jgi:hypothetical protein
VPRHRRGFDAWTTERASILDCRLSLVRIRTTRAIGADGCTGPIVLRLHGAPEDVGALCSLARFGTFSGTGRRLAHGFGQTVVADAPADWPSAVTVHVPVPRR